MSIRWAAAPARRSPPRASPAPIRAATNILVDGVQQKDNFGLNASGTTSTRDAIPLEWAASVQVALTPYDVQYNDTCGGVVNVVTKSGTNEFHGSVYGYYKDASLNGTDFNLWNANSGTTAVTKTTIRPSFVEKRYGGDLSGTIIPDTLFFFVGYDELKRSSSPGATAVGPAGSNYTSVAAGITTAQVNQIIADAKNVYGFDAGNLADNFSEYNQRYMAKLTWQINDDHALTGSYQHVTGAQLAINNGSSSASLPRVNLPSNWYENAQKNEVYQLQATDHWTSDFTTEETIGHLGVRQAPTPLDGTDFPEIDVQTPGADGNIATLADNGYVRLGPDFSRQYNLLLYTNNYAKALATYVAGRPHLRRRRRVSPHRHRRQVRPGRPVGGALRFGGGFRRGQNIAERQHRDQRHSQRRLGGFRLSRLYRQRLRPHHQDLQQCGGGRPVQLRHQLLVHPGHLLPPEGHDGAVRPALRPLLHQPL